MERALQKELIAWKNKPSRMPLILQGARQVGKTYLMRWLGKEAFSDYAYFNFDERPELKEFFQKNKDTSRILESLSFISGKKISNQTLIIFDEIQECSEALNALKYFAEQKPEIPIICAGSLLGILLNSGVSFPVGKVEFLTLYPMTFREVLPNWNNQLHAYLEQLNSLDALPEYYFNDLLHHFKKYMITGGMPAVVKAFNESQTFENTDDVLNNLILSYKGDFAKHPVMSDVAKISEVFDSLPAQLARENKKFVFQLVRSGARAREYEDAIRWLMNAGLVYQIKLCTKPALPLSAYDQHNAFKLYGLDVGIIRKLSKLSPAAIIEGNRLFTEFKGALTENYILQSLIVQFKTIPHYWTSGNTAEVDFLIQLNNEIIPVEIKSDENVRSKSLAAYQSAFKPKLRIRYSLKNLHHRDGLLNIPLFLSDYTQDLIQLTKQGQSHY